MAEQNSLEMRRAVFVYEAARLAAIAAMAPVIPASWADREEDFRAQFVRVVAKQCGPQRSSSPEELHGSWVQAYLERGWTYGKEYNPDNRFHPDLVPYANLGVLEKDKDTVFILLCDIARQYIRADAGCNGGCYRRAHEDLRPSSRAR